MTADQQITYTEAQLVALCKKNDKRAQRLMFEQESKIMLTVCRRYIGDDHTAEELMLIGFMKVFDKMHQFKSEGSLQGWIRRVMVTTCLEWIRKNKALYMEVELENVESEIDAIQAANTLESADLLAMVMELPQGYRTIFNMYAIEGYSHPEIAAQLGISINTSKSQLSRARKLLQDKISKSEKYVTQNRMDHGS
ncbi:hypothetical protein BFP72_03550 [Reichenbachiella sp. 5M10]|nr:hypothetical protein BFP72_03550 [Reichenbachiella sp. 5M10]